MSRSEFSERFYDGIDDWLPGDVCLTAIKTAQGQGYRDVENLSTPSYETVILQEYEPEYLQEINYGDPSQPWRVFYQGTSQSLNQDAWFGSEQEARDFIQQHLAGRTGINRKTAGDYDAQWEPGDRVRTPAGGEGTVEEVYPEGGTVGKQPGVYVRHDTGEFEMFSGQELTKISSRKISQLSDEDYDRFSGGWYELVRNDPQSFTDERFEQYIEEWKAQGNPDPGNMNWMKPSSLPPGAVPSEYRKGMKTAQTLPEFVKSTQTGQKFKLWSYDDGSVVMEFVGPGAQQDVGNWKYDGAEMQRMLDSGELVPVQAAKTAWQPPETPVSSVGKDDFDLGYEAGLDSQESGINPDTLTTEQILQGWPSVTDAGIFIEGVRSGIHDAGSPGEYQASKKMAKIQPGDMIQYYEMGGTEQKSGRVVEISEQPMRGGEYAFTYILEDGHEVSDDDLVNSGIAYQAKRKMAAMPQVSDSVRRVSDGQSGYIKNVDWEEIEGEGRFRAVVDMQFPDGMEQANGDQFGPGQAFEILGAKYAEKFEGQSDEQVRKTWNSLGGSHESCVANVSGVDDPDAYCAALKDRVTGTTKWRGKESMQREIDAATAEQVAKAIGAHGEVDLEQFRMGMAAEMEHNEDPETDVVPGDDLKTVGQIAWAHLKEMPNYYTKLEKMESSGSIGKGAPVFVDPESGDLSGEGADEIEEIKESECDKKKKTFSMEIGMTPQLQQIQSTLQALPEVEYAYAATLGSDVENIGGVEYNAGIMCTSAGVSGDELKRAVESALSGVQAVVEGGQSVPGTIIGEEVMVYVRVDDAERAAARKVVSEGIPSEIEGVPVEQIGDKIQTHTGVWVTLMPVDLTDGREWQYDVVNGKTQQTKSGALDPFGSDPNERDFAETEILERIHPHSGFEGDPQTVIDEIAQKYSLSQQEIEEIVSNLNEYFVAFNQSSTGAKKTAQGDPDVNWGQQYGGSGPSFQTPNGPVWMFRKGQAVRFYDQSGQQVGPEQSNVAPATAYALSEGWRDILGAAKIAGGYVGVGQLPDGRGVTEYDKVKVKGREGEGVANIYKLHVDDHGTIDWIDITWNQTGKSEQKILPDQFEIVKEGAKKTAQGHVAEVDIDEDRKLRWGQDENGMYWAEILDDMGMVESGTLQNNIGEVRQWMTELGVPIPANFAAKKVAGTDQALEEAWSDMLNNYVIPALEAGEGFSQAEQLFYDDYGTQYKAELTQKLDAWLMNDGLKYQNKGTSGYGTDVFGSRTVQSMSTDMFDDKEVLRMAKDMGYMVNSADEARHILENPTPEEKKMLWDISAGKRAQYDMPLHGPGGEFELEPSEHMNPETQKRDAVIQFMSASGPRSGDLTRDEFVEVYLEGDGFGTIDEAFAQDQSFDWSHVRDSSAQGIERMYSRLKQMGKVARRRSARIHRKAQEEGIELVVANDMPSGVIWEAIADWIMKSGAETLDQVERAVAEYTSNAGWGNVYRVVPPDKIIVDVPYDVAGQDAFAARKIASGGPLEEALYNIIRDETSLGNPIYDTSLYQVAQTIQGANEGEVDQAIQYLVNEGFITQNKVQGTSVVELKMAAKHAQDQDDDDLTSIWIGPEDGEEKAYHIPPPPGMTGEEYRQQNEEMGAGGFVGDYDRPFDRAGAKYDFDEDKVERDESGKFTKNDNELPEKTAEEGGFMQSFESYMMGTIEAVRQNGGEATIDQIRSYIESRVREIDPSKLDSALEQHEATGLMYEDNGTWHSAASRATEIRGHELILTNRRRC